MQASFKSLSSPFPFPSPPPHHLYKSQVSKVTHKQRNGNAEIIDAQIKMYAETEEGNKKKAAGPYVIPTVCCFTF